MSAHGYSTRFDDAVAFALDAFRAIRRKGTDTAYVTHLLAVTALVGEAGGDEEQLMAAVLHDVLEDVPTVDAAALRSRFGERVARLVEALSDTTETPKPPWRPRKEAYLAHLRGQPAEVKLISAADTLHNATTLVRDLRADGVATFARFSGGREGTLWYYSAVHAALADGWSHWLVDELGAAVDAMHAAAAP